VQISPGYDFSVNEIPTNAKLQQMVAGMSITGIDIGQIDTTLIAEIIGPTSATMPVEGWLRVDALNRIWVRDANAKQVCLDRGNWGGWETVRMFAGKITGVGDTWPYGAGETSFPLSARFEPSWNTVNDTNATNLYLKPSVGANTQVVNLKALETGVSGSVMRVLGRGGSVGIIANANRSPAQGFWDHIPNVQTLGATNYTNVNHAITSIGPNQGVGLVQGVGLMLMWQYGATYAEQ
jgi:hypothetical protein